MFALINTYIAKGENSFLPEVVYKRASIRFLRQKMK